MPNVTCESSGGPAVNATRRAVLATLAAISLTPTAAMANTVSVADFGARGDGYTDDAAAFQAALRALPGGGTIVVPRAPVAYVIGDGNRKGSSLKTPSGIGWRGEGARLVHRARTDEGQNELFEIENCSDVTVDGFIIDGEQEVRKPIKLAGQTRRIALRNIEIVDCVNFGIVCGEDGSSFEDVLIERVMIHGACGVAGTGSGINFFPRLQVGDAPASRGLVIRDVTIDVSDGRSPKKQKKRSAGPQCIKLNNLVGAVIERCTGSGAAIAGINITNGSSDIRVVNSTLSDCLWGLRITARSNDAVTPTRNITLQGISTARNRKGSVSLESGIANIRIENCGLDGDIVLSRSPLRKIILARPEGAGRTTWRDASGKKVKILGRRDRTIMIHDAKGTLRLEALTDQSGQRIDVIGEADNGTIEGLNIFGGQIGGIRTAGKLQPALAGFRMEGTLVTPGGKVRLPREQR